MKFWVSYWVSLQLMVVGWYLGPSSLDLLSSGGVMFLFLLRSLFLDLNMLQ